MNFEDDFTDSMMRDGFNYFGENEETAWANFRERFAMSPRGQRVDFIRKVDTYLDAPAPPKRQHPSGVKSESLSP
jgi:hypothetical protein